jgi:hypothetical protein
MNTQTALAAQLSTCALSFSCHAVLGSWTDVLPWRVVLPLSLGLLWLAITFWIIVHEKSKIRFMLIAAAELPFAFGWPAWVVILKLFGGGV